MIQPSLYRIRVSGRLGPEWSERLGGMTVSAGEESITEISGRLTDQAALMGVLDQLYNCGIHLLSMERVSAGSGDE